MRQVDISGCQCPECGGWVAFPPEWYFDAVSGFTGSSGDLNNHVICFDHGHWHGHWEELAGVVVMEIEGQQ